MGTLILGLGLMLTASAAGAETKADDILGEWMTDKNESKIVVTKKEGKYYGKLTWLDEPNYPEDDEEGEAGVAKHDRLNPDKDLQSRPIIGLQLLSKFVFDKGDKTWEKGKIYDPESGKLYKCVIRLGEKGELNVRGYIGLPALGRTTTWTRPKPKDEAETKAE